MRIFNILWTAVCNTRHYKRAYDGGASSRHKSGTVLQDKPASEPRVLDWADYAHEQWNTGKLQLKRHAIYQIATRSTSIDYRNVASRTRAERSNTSIAEFVHLRWSRVLDTDCQINTACTGWAKNRTLSNHRVDAAAQDKTKRILSKCSRSSRETENKAQIAVFLLVCKEH